MVDKARPVLEHGRGEARRAPDTELVVEEDDHEGVEVSGADDRELWLPARRGARGDACLHLEALAIGRQHVPAPP